MTKVAERLAFTPKSLSLVGDCQVTLYTSYATDAQGTKFGTGDWAVYRFTDMSTGNEAVRYNAKFIEIEGITPAEKDGVYLFKDTNYNSDPSPVPVLPNPWSVHTLAYADTSSVLIYGPYRVALVDSSEKHTVSLHHNSPDLGQVNSCDGSGCMTWNDTAKYARTELAPIAPPLRY